MGVPEEEEELLNPRPMHVMLNYAYHKETQHLTDGEKHPTNK